MKYINCLSVLYDIAPSQKHTVLMVVYFEQFPNPSHIQALYASERNPHHAYMILSHTAVHAYIRICIHGNKTGGLVVTFLVILTYVSASCSGNKFTPADNNAYIMKVICISKIFVELYLNLL